MNPMSRKALLTLGGVVTAATLTLGGGVASAAERRRYRPPQAAAHAQHRARPADGPETPRRRPLRQGRCTATTRAGKLATKVDALPDGAKKTDAQAKLADLATKTAAATTADASVISALEGSPPPT